MGKPTGVFVIAEAGVNHNGSLDMALRLVDAAAEAGADAVKFQTFRAETLVSRHAAKAEYQRRTTDPDESQFDMLRRLELSEADHFALLDHCRARDLEFLSTPFDLDTLRFLIDRLGVRRLKLGSGDLNNAPLVLAAGRSGLPIILSTGMASLTDVEEALGVLSFALTRRDDPRAPADFRRAFADPAARAALAERVALLHCTTRYPTPASDVNLRAMATLKAAFGLRVGYSDHTMGITASIAAVALGAEIVEKHLTLDRAMPGPDHAASADPSEFKALLAAVREVEAALGDPLKRPTEGEIPNMAAARKSLVAARPIAEGETFTLDNLTTKRPGTGLAPIHYWSLLGRPAPRAYAADETIDPWWGQE